MLRKEARLLDDGVLFVQSTVAMILREHDGQDPRTLDLDSIQAQLDRAFARLGARPVLCVNGDRLSVEFVPR